MGLDEDAFYDPRNVAIVPMGFCYPGRGQGGDAPPRPECAPLWRDSILSGLEGIRLTLVIGAHAQRWHMGPPERSVAERARTWLDERGNVVALPHPSPRNNAWLARHPWFELEVLPRLRRRVVDALNA
jgi:uracil-DNA glycosylase